MKDDAVERVLAGLGKVEAPTGLGGRVLRRMAEADSQRAVGRKTELRLAGGLVLAGVLVGILGHLRGGHTPGAKAPLPRGAERPKAEALGYLQANRTAMTAATGDSAGSRGRDGRTPLGDNARRIAAPAHVSESRSGAPGLLAGMESFPAPPAPLTEQERLLVRVARHPQRSDAQFLIAEVREAELARGNEEFERFFPPPKAEEEIVVSQPVQAKENHNEVEPKDR